MIKKKINDKTLLKQLNNIQADGKNIFLLEDNKIRATIINGTEMVNQMSVSHELGFVESYILGEAFIANALLASTVKGNDRVQITVECGGPVGGIYTEAWACGAVRGYLKNNKLNVKEEFPVDTDLLYGPGFLTITKLIEGNKSPFTGQVMLQKGNLAEDLGIYFKESEQTPSIFIIDFKIDDEKRIIGCGGIFLQSLPGCDDETFKTLEAKCKELPSLALYISEGKDPKDYINEQFEGSLHLSHSIIGFSCPCDRQNFAQHLKNLPIKEKNELISNGPFPLELICSNCNSKYYFSEEELKVLLK